MLIIKIGGSVFAPKKSNKFDKRLLKNIFSIISDSYEGQVILIHGTGNFGHDFVNEFGVNAKTFEIYKKRRKIFFNTIDEIFFGYERILAESTLDKENRALDVNKNYIISGDINSKNLEIISSDIIFSVLIKDCENCDKFILTDVDGVFDQNNELISELSLSNLNKITFWAKPGDVTDAMQGKLLSLENSVLDKDGIWITNGQNTENFEKLIKTGTGTGTYIQN